MLLGFDIGGTKMAVALGSPDGRLLGRREFPACDPDRAKANFFAYAHELLREHGVAKPLACGISAPGPMSSSAGLILNPPNMLSWVNVPVKQWIESEFMVPTGMENDANAGALAEWKWGLKGKCDNVVYLTCGTGMGAGFVLNGKLYRGKQDLAGEIGHVRLRQFGPVGFYKAGSVEGLTSAVSLGKLAALRREELHEASCLDKLPVGEITGKAVGEAVLAGDAFALRVLQENAGYLGETVGMLLDLLNPERISLGSLAVRLGNLYIDPVRAAAKREALPVAFENCVIDAAVLGDKVQDLAALAVAAEATR